MKSHWDQNIALNPQSVEADKNFFKVYSQLLTGGRCTIANVYLAVRNVVYTRWLHGIVCVCVCVCELLRLGVLHWLHKTEVFRILWGQLRCHIETLTRSVNVTDRYNRLRHWIGTFLIMCLGDDWSMFVKLTCMSVLVVAEKILG